MLELSADLCRSKGQAGDVGGLVSERPAAANRSSGHNATQAGKVSDDVNVT